MNFFADEGLDVPLVEALRKNGFTVAHALEIMPGADDEEILAAAVARNAILITKDKDFGEIVVHHSAKCDGVVLIRIDELSDGRNIQRILEVMLRYAENLAGSFTVIQQDRIRIRRLE